MTRRIAARRITAPRIAARRITAACMLVVPLLLTACAQQTQKPQPTDEPYVGSGRMDNMNSTGAPPTTADSGTDSAMSEPTYTGSESAEPAPKPQPKPKNTTAAKPKTTASKNRSYTVQKGDTLSEIAKKYYGDANKWRTIYNANKSKISDPKKLKVGTKLIIP